MKRLSQHIYQLLVGHNCVIVPELGGFVAQYMPARYDEAEESFFPPCRQISFNAQLTINDGLLVQSYMESEHADFIKASEYVSQDIAQLKRMLDNEGRVELTDIGTLSMSLNGRFIFESDKSTLTTPEYYGLDSFSAYLVAQDNVVAQEDNETLSLQDTNDIVETSDNNHYVLRIHKEFANYVAAAMLALICYFAWALPTDEQGQMNVAQVPAVSVSVNTTEASPAKTDTVASEVYTAESNDEVNEIKENAPSAPTYVIVLASQVSKKNAEFFIAKLNKKGFSEARLITQHFNRVVYGTYSSEKDAYNALRKYQAQANDFSDAWVMKLSI